VAEGFDVVYAQRLTRDGEMLSQAAPGTPWLSRDRTHLRRPIPPNTGEFRLMSRRVVDHVVALRESHGFLRGLVSLVGFRQTGVLYNRQARAAVHEQVQPVCRLAGHRAERDRRVLALPAPGDLAAGYRPFWLRVLSRHRLPRVDALRPRVPGWHPTIVILVTFFSGIQLLSLGVMGEYVGRIYDEVRQRPKYIVESRHGFNEH